MVVSKGRFALGAIALSFFLVTMPGRARAATITVDTLTDGSIAGHCTLRDAIIAADARTATNNCIAGTGTDTIRQPGKADCHGKSVAAVIAEFGSLDAAASALGFPSVKALQKAIRNFCRG